MTNTFSISKINSLRRRAVKACALPKRLAEGWSKSIVDPAAVLAVFDALRLKPGFALRAYLFRKGDNGNGFVWALPESAEFPAPDALPMLGDRFLNPPKPPAALDDVMEVIEGDGSPWSYISASCAYLVLANKESLLVLLL